MLKEASGKLPHCSDMNIIHVGLGIRGHHWLEIVQDYLQSLNANLFFEHKLAVYLITLGFLLEKLLE